MGRTADNPAVGWTDAIRAQLALVRAAWDVRRRRTGRLLSMDAEEATGEERSLPSSNTVKGGEDDLSDARRIGESVRVVARRGLGRPRCLVKALAVKRLLDDEGLEDARVRVGVKEDPPDIRAHAWVEFRGHVVGEFEENVEGYADLPGLHVHATVDGGEARRDS